MKSLSPTKNLRTLREAIKRIEQLSLPDAAKTELELVNRELADMEGGMDRSIDQARLSALYKLSRTLGTSLHIDEVLTRVMDAVIELTEAERGFLMLIDAQGGHLDLRAARNIEGENLHQKDMEVSRSVIQTVLEQGRGVVTTNAQTDPRFASKESVILYALRSILCTPLIWRGKVIGAIYVDNRAQAGTFDEQDLELLDAFATQAAMSIENARLYTQTDKNLADRIAELETLSRIDRQLNSDLNPEYVVEITRKWAIQSTGANDGWVALVDQEPGSLKIMAGPGEGQTIQLKSRYINEAWNSMSTQAYPPGDDGQARIVAPVLHMGKPIGVVVVERAEQFQPEATQFLDRLASRAAISIANSRLYQAVQLANVAKSRFVSAIVHELRIPMTSIKGYTDLLRHGAAGTVNETQSDFLEIIRNNVNRMAILVSDISDISRIESGRLSVNVERLDLKQLIQETANSLAPELNARHQQLDIDLPEDMPGILADSQRFVQVLTNITGNAIKYSAEGSKIIIHAASLEPPAVSAPMVRFDVIDQGIGIGPEDQKRIFSQFFRSDDPFVRDQQGWGLGLSVARSLVELMGGEIGVQSKIGAGSDFWFTLPCETHEIA